MVLKLWNILVDIRNYDFYQAVGFTFDLLACTMLLIEPTFLINFANFCLILFLQRRNFLSGCCSFL